MDGLIDLARRDGIDIKPTLLRVLTDLYVQSPTHSSDEEAQFAELACRLIASADADTRAAVAARLNAYPRTPLAVLNALSEHEAKGAAPLAAETSMDEHSDDDEAELAELFGGAPQEHHDLCEEFFRANAEERLAILRNLEFAPIEPALVPVGPRVSDAFARMEKAALAGRKISLTAELGALLHLSRSLADRIVQDKGGEPLACALRAAGMPQATYQRILLFLDPAIGRSVARVFALDRLYREITPRAAQIMLGIWRGASARAGGARYQSPLQDDVARRTGQAQSAATGAATRAAAQRASIKTASGG